MRKHLIVLLVLGLVLTSCAVPGLAKRIAITHWQHHSPARIELVKELAIKFMEEHPNVDIQIESIPYGDYFKKLLPALAAGSGPDTFQIPAGEVPAYVAAGVAGPLSEEVIDTEEIEKAFIASALEHLKFDGLYYGLPTDVQSVVLFYNPKLFEEAGLDPNQPPQTWAELVEYAKKIHKRDENGVTTQMGVATGGYGPVLFSLAIQNGAKIYDEEKQRPDFYNEETMEALQFATDLVTKHEVEDLQLGSRWTAFRQEKLGMVYAHPAMIGSFRATVPDLDFRICEIPAPEEGGSQESLVTSWAYVRSSKLEGEAQKLATEWIALLTGEEAQKMWTLKTGELPTRLSVVNDPEFANDPLLGPVMESMKKAVPEPWQSRIVRNEALHKAWQLVVLKGETVEKALQFGLDLAIEEEEDQLEKSNF